MGELFPLLQVPEDVTNFSCWANYMIWQGAFNLTFPSGRMTFSTRTRRDSIYWVDLNTGKHRIQNLHPLAILVDGWNGPSSYESEKTPPGTFRFNRDYDYFDEILKSVGIL